MANIIRFGGGASTGGSYGTLPAQISTFMAQVGNAQVTLTWVNPTDDNFAGVAIVRKTGGYPASPTDGVKVYEGTAQTFTDTGLTNDVQYYYRAFAYNSGTEYQTIYIVATAMPKAYLLASALPVGSLLKIAENGVPQQYIIVHQGIPDATLYDASCNGTWILRKDILGNRAWKAPHYNCYSLSDIAPYLNTTFFNTLSQVAQNLIITAKIPYSDGGRTNTVISGTNGFSTKVFLLSFKEFGDNTHGPNDGVKLSYFESGEADSANLKRIAYLNNSPAAYWTRTANTSDSYSVNMVWEQGEFYKSSIGLPASADSLYGVRPAAILNSNAQFSVQVDVDDCYTLVEG